MLIYLLPAMFGAEKIQFTRLNIKEGLSQSIVYSIVQDHLGFMWFSTEDGLNRYDGHRFHIIKKGNQLKKGLSHDNITVSHIDRKGVLWLGTFHGGLNRLNINSGEITHFQFDNHKRGTISSNIVKAIADGPKGGLWIGTDKGLDYMYANGSFEPLLSGLDIQVIRVYKETHLYLGTRRRGVIVFDIQNRKASDPASIPYKIEDVNTKSVQAISFCTGGELWIGCDDGLYQLPSKSADSDRITRRYDEKTGLGHQRIWTIMEDRDGCLWVGTENGLSRFHKKSNRFDNYRNKPTDPGSLSINIVRSLYQDNSGLIWVGTYGGGINAFNPEKKKFQHFASSPDEPNSLSHNIVWTIYEDIKGVLWIGTHGGGMDRLDRERTTIDHFRFSETNPNTISHDQVRMIVGDKNGRLWIGTNGGGLNCYVPDAKQFIRYRHQSGENNSISNDNIRALRFESPNQLWIGTYGGGLDLLNTETGTFSHFKFESGNPNSLSNDVIRAIVRDHKNRLWIGTYGGGICLKRENRDYFLRFNSEKYQNFNNFVFCIHEDRKKRLWVGTESGFYQFDVENDRFLHIQNPAEMRHHMIYGILEDKRGDLWLSSNSGLIRYNPEKNSFKNYYESDGLASNEFNGGAFHKSDSGEMFFGSINGFNSFYPDLIVDKSFIPPIIISDFKKMNKSFSMDIPAYSLTELNLSYKDYFISIEFAALDYSIPEKLKYAYKLEGLDTDWIQTGADNRIASYTNLQPGSYTFMVKGTNSDGIWNEIPRKIDIYIHPPFYGTLWFKLLSIFLLILISVVIYRKRMKNLFYKTRIETELEKAHQAQMTIMPQKDPVHPKILVSGICIPANEVGGDFFDYLNLGNDEEQFALTIGDVSGKAMKAAMSAVLASGLIYAKSSEFNSIEEIVNKLNQDIYTKIEKNTFIALCIAGFDWKGMTLNYINAGLPVILLKRGGHIFELKNEENRLPLGINPKGHYRASHFDIKAGDIFLFCTDGVTEAWNSKKAFYSTDRLKQFIHQLDTRNMDSKETQQAVMADIRTFTGNVPLHDDISLIVAKIK